MNFPFTITIADQQELNRLIRDIAQPIIEATVDATLLRFGKISSFMSPAECYRLSKKSLVDKALARGQLKYTFKSGKKIIQREDFNKWKSKNTF